MFAETGVDVTEFPAVHHVALTVANLEASREWYRRLLGTEPVIDEDVPALAGHHQGFHHTVFAVPGGTLLALHEHAGTDPDAQFDEFRPGLDHISFGCIDRSHLERWESCLEELGIKHSGIAQDAIGFGLSFRDPDNIALEFWTPVPRS
jgi:glyoxylase I family protein